MTSTNVAQEESIRCFFAIVFDEATQHALQAIINQLKQRYRNPKIRWIAQEKLHLTLRFMGNVQRKQLSTLNALISQALDGITPFTLELGTPQLFPNKHHARIISLHAEPKSTLNELATRLESAIVQAGYPQEKRPFRPHSSLARLKQVSLHHLHLETKSIQQRIKAIDLVQSESTTEGVQYHSIARYPLF